MSCLSKQADVLSQVPPEAVEGGRGAGARRVGERLSVGGDVLEGEEGVREMVEGVRDAGGTGFGIKQTWKR